jgi:hypothetical protein
MVITSLGETKLFSSAYYPYSSGTFSDSWGSFSNGWWPYYILPSRPGELVFVYPNEELSRQKYKKQNYYFKRQVLREDTSQTTLLIDDFSLQIDDTITRYKCVNNTESYYLNNAEPFLSALKLISAFTIPRITFYDDAVKARIIFKGREFIIDYDFAESDMAFVSTFVNDDDLIIKDDALTDLFSILETF